jgi:transcriptional regulator with XRE-family HTH domain
MNPESIYQHIGALIRSHRKKMKPPLTQAMLAGLLGISRASLANIETGRQSVLVHQLYGFAEALSLSPSDFLLPIADAATGAEWGEKLPSSLKPQQKDQIARLLANTQPDSTRIKGSVNVKQAKR